jgi:hypothetical protein
MQSKKQSLREYKLTSRLGWYSDDYDYLICYEKSANILFESVDKGRVPVDYIAAPMLFLMRHSIELGYKININFLAQFSQLKDEVDNTQHFLRKLHEALKKHFVASIDILEIPEDIVKSFQEVAKDTEKSMTFFDMVDKASYNFRYEKDKSGQKVFDRNTTINLLQVKNDYDKAMSLLKYTRDVLSPMVEYWQWKEDELRQIYEDEMNFNQDDYY